MFYTFVGNLTGFIFIGLPVSVENKQNLLKNLLCFEKLYDGSNKLFNKKIYDSVF